MNHLGSEFVRLAGTALVVTVLTTIPARLDAAAP
jgi:hypothetical protein